MGQQASVPKSGTKFQVIGAGLSRTGTASLSRALEILLDAPVYHGGTQSLLGPPVDIKTWIRVSDLWIEDYKRETLLSGTDKVSEADLLRQRRDKLDHVTNTEPYAVGSTRNREEIKKLIQQRLNGFAAVTDIPFTLLVPELLELFPDAMVICTTRDPESWHKSMNKIKSNAREWFLWLILLPLPTLRHFFGLTDRLAAVWGYTYSGSESEFAVMADYDKHYAMLEKMVPAEKLVFVRVKDGWEPLCRALGKEIPDVPFPKINDSDAVDEFAAAQVKKGLRAWRLIITTTLGLSGLSYLIWTQWLRQN